MRFIPDEYVFLLAILGTVILKLFLSTTMTFFKAVATAFSAFFIAIVFTDPLLRYMEWDPSNRVAIAVFLGLTGEHFARHVIDVAQNPGKAKGIVAGVVEIMKIWFTKDSGKDDDK